MPELCRFYGMIIQMMYNDNRQHNIPHIHVNYAGEKISVTFDGKIIVGKLPAKQLKLLQIWIKQHKNELGIAWNKAIKGEPFGVIEPLE